MLFSFVGVCFCFVLFIVLISCSSGVERTFEH